MLLCFIWIFSVHFTAIVYRIEQLIGDIIFSFREECRALLTAFFQELRRNPAPKAWQKK